MKLTEKIRQKINTLTILSRNTLSGSSSTNQSIKGIFVEYYMKLSSDWKIHNTTLNLDSFSKYQ